MIDKESTPDAVEPTQDTSSSQQEQESSQMEGLPSYFNALLEDNKPEKEVKPAEGETPPEGEAPQEPEETPEQRQEKIAAITAKPEAERTADEKILFSEHQEELNQKKYAELAEKPDEELTDEDKTFMEDNRPLTAVEIAKVASMRDFGVDLIDIEIPDTADGLSEVLSHVHGAGKHSGIQEVAEKYPPVKHLLEYLALGGDPDTYRGIMYPEIDFTTMEIIPDEEYDAEEHPSQDRMRQDVLVYDLKQQGYEDQDIVETIQKFKDANIMGSMAEKAHKRLSKEQTELQTQILERQKAEQEQNIAEYNAYIEDLQNRLDKAPSVAGLPVSPETKKTFMQFMTMTRQDSMIKDIPYSSEVVYHMFNPESPLYNHDKFRSMREATLYFTFMYEQNPQFLEKVVENRATTLKAKQALPAIGANNRLRTLASTDKAKQENYLSGKLIM